MKPIHWKPDCQSKDHHKDIDACMERIAKLKAQNEKLAEELNVAALTLHATNHHADPFSCCRNAVCSEYQAVIALAKETEK